MGNEQDFEIKSYKEKQDDSPLAAAELSSAAMNRANGSESMTEVDAPLLTTPTASPNSRSS